MWCQLHLQACRGLPLGAAVVARCRYLHRPRATRRWDGATECGRFLEPLGAPWTQRGAEDVPCRWEPGGGVGSGGRATDAGGGGGAGGERLGKSHGKPWKAL